MGMSNIKRGEAMSKKNNDKRPDIDQQLYDSGIIVLPSDIDDDSLLPAVKAAISMGTQRHVDTVRVFLNSYGGDTGQAFQLVEILLGLPQKVITYGIGDVCSAGVFIFLAGDERIATPRAVFLLHQYSWGKQGKYHELKARRGVEDAYFASVYKYVAERASVEAADLNNAKSDTWIMAKEAKRVKVVTKLVNRIKLPKLAGGK